MDDELQKKGFEKLMDKAFSFLDILIIPPLKEVGGIMEDSVKLWRYKNQVNILLKVQEYHKKKGLSPRKVPVKMLANLLDTASYEEDENLKEKWIALLANATNPENEFTLQNIFIDILKQMGSTEAQVLDFMWEESVFHTGQRYQRSFDVRIMQRMQFAKEKEGINFKYDREIEKVVLDNLIRLNLIEYKTPSIIDRSKLIQHGEPPEYVIKEREQVQLTQLGQRFMMECKID